MSDSRSDRRSILFDGSDALTDNTSLFEWLDATRRVLHTGSLELSTTAAELEARLRAVSHGVDIGGLSARARARKVCRPIGDAGEALVVASKYIIHASAQFEAVYLPELEACGYIPKRNGFGFRGTAK